MNIVSTSAASGQGTHERSVQTYIDETPVWADGTTVQSTPLTAMQWRIWTLATAGKFFEGLVVFMTGVALPLIARGIRHHESPAWHNRRGELVWHPDRRHRPRRAIRLFRPQGHVHCRNDYFYDFPVLAGDELQLHLAGCFPVRPRRSARLRLSNRPFGHFRKHSEQHARETCARRLRLPGHWRADRDGHRLSGAQEHSRDWRLALDVCHGHHSRVACDHRPLFDHGKRPLAAAKGPQKRGTGGIGPASGAQPDVSKESAAHAA